MAVSRFSANFRTRSDVFDSITPNVIRQRDISAPNGEWKPAPWLPVQWTSSNLTAGEDAFVISKGKVVALTRQGHVVPAGYLFFATLVAATSDIAITYTADDYEWGVMDITTGARYATNGTTTYTAKVVAEALLERGLVTEDEVTQAVADYGIASYSTSDMPTRAGVMTIAEVQGTFAAFISKPVGISAVDVYVWSGRPEDGDQFYTNYSKQHLIQFLTEAQMVVPHRAADSTSSDVFTGIESIVPETADNAGDFPRAGEIWEAAQLALTTRYGALGVTSSTPVVAFCLAEDNVAANTDRTPVTCDVDGVLSKEKSAISLVTSEGDWYLDADVGVIIVHEDTYATLVAATSDPTFSYFFYEEASAVTDVASAHRYVHFDGLAVPGDKLGVDKHSNFVKSNSLSDVLNGGSVLGCVLSIESQPRTLLNKVKTAYNLSNMSASGKMPGTATKGFTDMITLSQEDVADRCAVLLVRAV
jgi:hypothetical protein